MGKVYQILEQVPDFEPIHEVLNEEELLKSGLVPVKTFIFSKAAEKSLASLKAKKHKEKLDGEGVAQVNVEAPRKIHQAIKEFARRAKLGEPLRDCLFSLLCSLDQNFEVEELRDLEESVKLFRRKGKEK